MFTEFMHILWIISLTLLLVYFLRIMFLRYGWGRLLRKQVRGAGSPCVSIVVPVRNEEKNIAQLLEDLSRQDYPEKSLEVILVDDHSTDGSPALIRSFCRDHPGFRYMVLDPAEYGKKAALQKGIKSAEHPLILNTDGDCRASPGWVAEMIAGFSDPGVKMVIGTVILEPDHGVFQAMQSLEFFSLSAAGAGSAGLNDPVLCNAANLAYYKVDYQRFLMDQEKISESGDDIFLMLWLKRQFPGSIRYSASRDAVIRSLPAPGLGSFLMQRRRWSSKNRHYRDISTTGTALLVLGMNTLLLILLLAILAAAVLCGTWKLGLIRLLAVLLLGKSIADLIFLAPVLRYYKKSRLLIYFLPLQIIYFMYVSLIGFTGQFLGYSWKGRKITVRKQNQPDGNKI